MTLPDSQPGQTFVQDEALCEYASHRDQLAETAAQLLKRGFSISESLYSAYSIVGEDVGDTTIRTALHDYFIGTNWIPRRVYRGGISKNNATTRGYTPAPLSLKTPPLTEAPETTYAVFSEPLSRYMARRALRHDESSSIDDCFIGSSKAAEEQAGVLLRHLFNISSNSNGKQETLLAIQTVAVQPSLPVAIANCLHAVGGSLTTLKAATTD